MKNRSSVLDLLLSALEVAEAGVVILDARLRVRAVNPSFRKLWQLEKSVGLEGFHFCEVLRQIVGRRTINAPENIDEYIKDRIALIKDGAATPRDVRLDDGRVIRATCQVLPVGGRLMLYTNVTDLVVLADRLDELAKKDELTGLLNRRELVRHGREVWSECVGREGFISALMVDIDNFKTINDQYGHAVGDQVISHVAAICRRQTRPSDVVARFGGEEFVVLLPGATREQATFIAERLRGAVADLPARIQDRCIPVTISIGVAAASPASLSVKSLIDDADKGLLAAKRAGRNQVRDAVHAA